MQRRQVIGRRNLDQRKVERGDAGRCQLRRERSDWPAGRVITTVYGAWPFELGDELTPACAAITRQSPDRSPC
jgi:hypothetical protein